MSNCDSVSEAVDIEAFATLCPSCFRAVQLMGGFDDGVDVLRKLSAVLKNTELFRRSLKVSQEIAKLEAWIPA
jgi:hypothetical protein